MTWRLGTLRWPHAGWLVVLMAGPVAADDVEVTGTAYTITYRGPAGAPEVVQRPGARPQRPQLLPFLRLAPAAAPNPAVQTLRLVNGRSGTELARAAYNRAIDGWMFQLPLTADVTRLPLCLVVKSAAGASLPLREERTGDDGYAFRNPPWEAEVLRLTELALLRRDRDTLLEQTESRAREVESLLGMVGTGTCVAAPQAADPPRPAGALPEAQARSAAPGVCALKWQQAFTAQRVDATRLFADAGAEADWNARDAAKPVAEALPSLRLAITPSEFALVTDAAVKGRNFLEHADGVRLFSRAQATCRDEVARLAQTAVADWEQQLRDVRQAPQRALAECKTRVARIAQLQTGLAKSQPYRAELEQRIATLADAAPASTKPARLDRETCKDL